MMNRDEQPSPASGTSTENQRTEQSFYKFVAPSFEDYHIVNGVSQYFTGLFQVISTMEEYSNKSLEELRHEHYQVTRSCRRVTGSTAGPSQEVQLAEQLRKNLVIKKQKGTQQHPRSGPSLDDLVGACCRSAKAHDRSFAQVTARPLSPTYDPCAGSSTSTVFGSTPSTATATHGGDISSVFGLVPSSQKPPAFSKVTFGNPAAFATSKTPLAFSFSKFNFTPKQDSQTLGNTRKYIFRTPAWNTRSRILRKDKRSSAKVNLDLPTVFGRTVKATQSWFEEPSIEEQISCPMCMETYMAVTRCPVVLPRCGHTFCRPCLTRLELRDTVQSPVLEERGSVQSPVLEERGSVQSPVLEERDSVQSPVLGERGSVQSPVLEERGSVECPICMTTHSGPAVSELPILYTILSLSESYNKAKAAGSVLERCETHGDQLCIWCRQCSQALCGLCLLDAPHHQYHKLERIINIADIDINVKKQARNFFEYSAKQQTKVTNELHIVIKRVVELCHMSNTIESQVKTISDVLKNKGNKVGIKLSIKALSQLKDAFKTLDQVNMDHSGSNEIQTTNSSRDKVHGSEDPDNEGTNSQAKGSDTGEGSNSQAKGSDTGEGSNSQAEGSDTGEGSNSQAEGSDTGEGFNSQAEGSDTGEGSNSQAEGSDLEAEASVQVECRDNGLGSNSQVKSSYIEGDNRDVKKSDNEASNRKNVKETDKKEGTSSQVIGSDNRNQSEADGNRSQIEALTLRCCGTTNDGRQMALRLEHDHLHLCALTPSKLHPHITLQVPLLERFLSQEKPEVFFELSVDNKCLGRVYIQLWGHMRRAKHFLALCLGSLGPSYRGSKFDKISDWSQPGEVLHCMGYSDKTGPSSKGLMDNLEWGGEYKQLQKAGQLIALGGGQAEKDGRFGICTKDNLFKTFSCPFGVVVSGMDVVCEAVNHVEDVVITEVGAVATEILY